MWVMASPMMRMISPDTKMPLPNPIPSSANWFTFLMKKRAIGISSQRIDIAHPRTVAAKRPHHTLKARFSGTDPISFGSGFSRIKCSLSPWDYIPAHMHDNTDSSAYPYRLAMTELEPLNLFASLRLVPCYGGVALPRGTGELLRFRKCGS